jgi:hydroxymethylpyrimidine pyrophosphatase-like HAD family hydrolase
MQGKVGMSSTGVHGTADRLLAPAAKDSGYKVPAAKGVPTAELEFYGAYDWSINPHLTVRQAIVHLTEEAAKLRDARNEWCVEEIATNIFLLSCGVLNCVEGHLRGLSPRLPGRVASTLFGRSAARFVEVISNTPWSRWRVGRWRQQWLSDLNDFLCLIVAPQAADTNGLFESAQRLTHLASRCPDALLAQRLGIPSPFGHLDLSPKDVLKLGDHFERRFPDRAQPVLLVGLRTSGAYFAPLLRAFLEMKGYQSVRILTIDPGKGIGRREERELKHLAPRGFWALVVDDPPDSCATLLAASDILHRAGFAAGSVKFVAPTHPARLTWFKAFPEDSVITLSPEHWYKSELLSPKIVEVRLAEYFRTQNAARVSVVASRRTDEFNGWVQNLASDERSTRLKRIFEVLLETSEGEPQTKYVLAKSVGWGWLGYRAFLIGHKHSGYVPPVLGLRDGILYMEWIQDEPAVDSADKRRALLVASAAYVAARVRCLSSTSGMDLKRYNNGSRLLAKAFSRAYGRFLTDVLMRSRLGKLVRELPCPCPTLIDGNMHPREWVFGPQGPLKTDYEHHGMGKNALNVTDPAYDLADTILNMELSAQEEAILLGDYIAHSRDAAVEQRLFIYKVLTGLWAMSQTQQQLFSSMRGADAQRDYHQRFMNAWNFLTVHTARYCGSLCHPRTDLSWRAPLVVLDIDGVLDRRLFGFPCTTVAGIKALSLLSSHDLSVALDTARSAVEVKEYCSAFSLAGGVAEHGSYLWDAVRHRGQVLISPEAERQLSEMRKYLHSIPGVFLDERHRYSIRAFTYRDKPQGLMHALIGSARASSVGDGALAPISTQLVHRLLVDMRLDQLTFHHTTIDTTIVAKETDKGTGLIALRDWVLTEGAEMIAIGDSEPDLDMFRVAGRSFAPANIACKQQARLLGCRLASAPHQQGLLEIVRKIIHTDNRRCERCCLGEKTLPYGDDLFLSVLEAADRSWTDNFLKAVFHPAAFRVFLR